MKPTLVVMTGPQGSGNHLFSKAFTNNPALCGWSTLKEKYWEGHDMEPFAEYWKDPKKLIEYDWNKSDYFITSISCPFFDDGVESVPKYIEFITEAKKYAFIKVLIIGRDQNILEHQQYRVRDKHTTPVFLDNIKYLLNFNPFFVSQELLYLYQLPYLNTIEQYLNLPLSTDEAGLRQILDTDANKKYITPVTTNWLDEHIKLASSKKGG